MMDHRGLNGSYYSFCKGKVVGDDTYHCKECETCSGLDHWHSHRYSFSYPSLTRPLSHCLSLPPSLPPSLSLLPSLPPISPSGSLHVYSQPLSFLFFSPSLFSNRHKNVEAPCEPSQDSKLLYPIPLSGKLLATRCDVYVEREGRWRGDGGEMEREVEREMEGRGREWESGTCPLLTFFLILFLVFFSSHRLPVNESGNASGVDETDEPYWPSPKHIEGITPFLLFSYSSSFLLFSPLFFSSLVLSPSNKLDKRKISVRMEIGMISEASSVGVSPLFSTYSSPPPLLPSSPPPLLPLLLPSPLSPPPLLSSIILIPF